MSHKKPFLGEELFGYFLHGKNNTLILTKIGMGYIFGNFLANSSGRPERKRDEQKLGSRRLPIKVSR
jgi:hypothetical protein